MRKYDLIEVVIHGNQPLFGSGESTDPKDIEYTQARLDFRARTVELPVTTLSFADVHTLWKAIEQWSQ